VSDLKPTLSPFPSAEPLLIHDRSLTGKVAQGSEAREIVDQQLHHLGAQLVTQLNVLLRTARSHGGANTALDRPLASIRTLVKTLGHEQPVALRVHQGFVFLGERHLKTTTRELPVYSSFIDSLSALGIGGLKLRNSATEAELRRFAELFAAAEPGEGAFEALRAKLVEAGIESVALEKPRAARKAETPQETPAQAAEGSASAVEVRRRRSAALLRQRTRSAYARMGTALKALNHDARTGGTLRFRQAKRAIQNIVDLLLKDPSTVLGLTTLRAHDEYTQNHSVNVALLSMALGNRIGYAKTELADLGLAGLFHDVGKCAIPLDVLNKPGEFSGDEWDLIRTHPSEGVLKLLGVRGIGNVPARMAAASFEHHLGFDGKGYPRLSTPWKQTLASRVISVADCYDAMTSARVYRREPMSPPDVLRFMFGKSGTTFEPVLLKYFVTCVGIIPIGTLVLLDTGELAVVARPAHGKHDASRPVARIIADAAGAPVEPPQEHDLRETGPGGAHLRTIVRLVDNTEHRLDTGRYVTA
jgi:HD-GYP domain-containing protein (c-di-GMP phosphodiesterase class II)